MSGVTFVVDLSDMCCILFHFLKVWYFTVADIS